MPELPEVETVRRGLKKIILDDATKAEIVKIELRRPDLRSKIPTSLPKKFAGQLLVDIKRRAKYLLFETPNGFLLNHLGMSGSWRVLGELPPEVHDHVLLHLEKSVKGKKQKIILVYNDPRRFGVLDQTERNQKSKWLEHLGPEPLDTKTFTSEYLFSQLKRRKAACKAVIMDQKVVVGVGNIYVAEALFKVGVRPGRASHRVTRKECENLVVEIRKILKAAIKAGGSTIKDFKQAGGSEGYFQQKLYVYGREGEPCRVCKTPIKNKVIAQRSSFYCPNCQK